MLRFTHLLVIFAYYIAYASSVSQILQCPDGTGDSIANPCLIEPMKIQDTYNILIPNTINYAVIDCATYGCQNNINIFAASKSTNIFCNKTESCTGLNVMCGRGPAGMYIYVSIYHQLYTDCLLSLNTL